MNLNLTQFSRKLLLLCSWLGLFSCRPDVKPIGKVAPPLPLPRSRREGKNMYTVSLGSQRCLRIICFLLLFHPGLPTSSGISGASLPQGALWGDYSFRWHLWGTRKDSAASRECDLKGVKTSPLPPSVAPITGCVCTVPPSEVGSLG